MPVEILPYQVSHIPSVRALNLRLRAEGASFSLSDSSEPRWLPQKPGTSLFQEYFLAVEGDSVHGGYTLKHQDFILNGEVKSLGFFQHPVSEGTIDNRYSLVAAQLLRHALRRHPLLYALGIGGYDEAAARLVQRARFGIEPIPFYFRVEHAAPFLREVRVLRSSPLRRLACDLGALTGLGALGFRLHRAYHVGRNKGARAVSANGFEFFDSAADAVWAANRDSIALGAVRDRHVLARLYDHPGNRFLRVAVQVAGEPCGWAVCVATQATSHKYFGDLRLGSIVDCLVRPGYERALIEAAVERLRQEDVDLIVTNQSLLRLRVALRDVGFLSGPSNFLFAASPKLAEGFQPLKNHVPRFHLNRGDGDGPINL